MERSIGIKYVHIGCDCAMHHCAETNYMSLEASINGYDSFFLFLRKCQIKLNFGFQLTQVSNHRKIK